MFQGAVGILLTSSYFLQATESSINTVRCESEKKSFEEFQQRNIEILRNFTNSSIASDSVSEHRGNTTCTFEYAEESTNYNVFKYVLSAVVIVYGLKLIHYMLNVGSQTHFTHQYKNIVSQLKWVILYIEGQNNQKIFDAFARSAPIILKRILSRGMHFDNVFDLMLREFAVIDRLGEGLKK